MNLTQINAFQAVMTSPSLSEAAKKLGRTQPAVSAAIKSLEEQLDMQLFVRDGRKLVPVPEARYLLTEAELILGQMARVRRTMRNLVEGQAGSLNVAAMPGPVSMLFPRFIANQIADTTGISVSMSARSSSQIAELARAQSIDFGFADAPHQNNKENLYRLEVISAECFVAVPKGHALAQKQTVSIADLSLEPMGSLQSTHAHQQEVLSLFKSRNSSFRAMVESQTFLPILQFVSAGQCCSILDPLTVVHVNASGKTGAGIRIRPMAEKIRYRYAIIAPLYRPESVLANRVKDAWKVEVMKLLKDVRSAPEIEG